MTEKGLYLERWLDSSQKSMKREGPWLMSSGSVGKINLALMENLKIDNWPSIASKYRTS